MNKLNSKLSYITIISLSLSFILGTSVYANEKETKLSLVGENYNESTLIREYRDSNNNEYIDSFLVPEHLVSNIESSADKVKEAKKVLFLYHTYRNEKEILERLKNQAFHEEGFILDVSEKYARTFQSDLASSIEFAENNADNSAIKKKYLAKEAESTLNDPPNERTKKPSEETPAVDESKVKDKPSDSSTFSYLFILVPLLLTAICGTVYYILTRR